MNGDEEIPRPEKLSKPSVVDLCAERIVETIHSGEWEELIPPIRVLCGTLGVNPATLNTALKKLVEKGVLEHRGDRKRYGIADKTKKTKPAGGIALPSKCALFITHQPTSQISDIARDILFEVERLLHAQGWTVVYDHFDFLHSRKPRKTWDVRLLARKPDCIVANLGQAVLAEWAATHKLPIFFIGGDSSEPLQTPMVAVSSAAMLRRALTELIALGHRRIFTPLCDRSPGYMDVIAGAYRDAFKKAGIDYYPQLHTPTSNYSSSESLQRMGERTLKVFKPTAFVVLDWKEFITLFGMCARHGIRIPQDISACVLEPGPLSEWFIPSVAHFKFPDHAMGRRVARWINEPHSAPRGLTKFDAEWVPGGSIAAPRP